MSGRCFLFIKKRFVTSYLLISIPDFKTRMRINFYAFYIFTVFCFLSVQGTAYARLPVQWGTYYGGNGGERTRAVTTDFNGNVYIGGYTDGTGVNMYTPGTYMGPSIVLPVNGFVAKFNSAGARLWGSLIPGEVNGITTDNGGNLYVTGKLVSGNLKGVNGGSFQQAHGGGTNDAFLIKLNGGTGQAEWVTYYGGPGNDIGYAVKTDAGNNVYLAGSTNSNTLATPGSHKTSLPGASPNFSTNFFLTKFTAAGARVWATYYGGTNSETVDFAPVVSLATDQENNVFLCGKTENIDQIASPTGFQQFKRGISDAFLVKFNSAGVRQWGTYYGGFSDDKGSDVVVDNEGNIYMTGYTQSNTNIATPGTYQPNYIPDGVSGSTFDDNMFVVKFNTSGFPEWGTYYKDRTAISNFNGFQNLVARLAFDPAGFICLAGARSADPTAKNFSSFSLSVARFDHNTGKIDFDTTIGSYLVSDFIGGVATDSSGNIFIGGYTESTDSIATSSGHDASYGQGGDAFLVKLKKADTSVYFKNLLAIKSVVCLGDTFSVPYGVTYNFNPGNKFTVQLYDIFAGTSFDIGEVTSQSSGKIFCTIPATIPLGSNYKIRIIASSPPDTTIDNSLIIRINREIEVTAAGDTAVCEGSPINLRGLVLPPGGYKFLWEGPDAYTSDMANPVIPNSTLSATGSYIVKVTNQQGGCLTMDTIDVRVKVRPLPPVASIDSPVCENDTLWLRAVSPTAGAGYHWVGPNGFSEGTKMTEIPRYNVNLGGTGIYTVISQLEDCVSLPVPVSTTVKPMPRFFDMPFNHEICEDDTLHLEAFSNGDSTYKWYGPFGYTSDSTNPVIAQMPYASRGEYRVHTWLDGCEGYATVNVDVHPKPKLSITNNSPLFEGEDLQLLVIDELFPDNVKYMWTGPDSFISVEREPVRKSVSDSASGTYHITVTTEHNCTYTTLTTVIVYKRNNEYFILYPSPNTGNFTVEGKVKYDQVMHFEVANSANQVIGKDFIETENRSFKTPINLEGKLSHGQYYFRIWINGEWETIPFTVIY